VGYTDSDFVGCKIIIKLIYSYLFIMGGGPISWKLKRLFIITYLTLEAEFIRLMEGNREVIWLRGLFSELKRLIQGLIPLMGDNKGVINTVYNPKYYNCTKYTLLKY